MSAPTPSSRTVRDVKQLKPRGVRWRRVFRGLMMLLLATLVGHWQWGRYEERRLERTLAELRATGEPVYPVDFAQGRRPPDEENAAVDLLVAAKTVNRESRSLSKFQEVYAGWPLSCEANHALDRLLEEPWVESVVSKVEAAARKPSIHWNESVDSPVVLQRWAWYFGDDVAEVLIAAACDAHRRGDDALALTRIEQALWVGRAVGKSSSTWTGRRVSDLACDAVLDLAPHLTPGAADAVDAACLRRLINQLLDDSEPREQFVRRLRYDRWLYWDTAKAVGEGRVDLREMWRRAPAFQSRTVGRMMKPLAVADGTLLVGHMNRLVHAARTTSDLRSLIGAAPELGVPDEVRKNVWLHLTAATLHRSYEREAYDHFRGITRRRLAATALALRCYAADHDGRMPSQLEELIPQYLADVPKDPLSVGPQNLRYLNGGDGRDEGAILYSVGDDSTDDGGSEEWPNRPWGDTRASIARWRQKDVVVRLWPTRQ